MVIIDSLINFGNSYYEGGSSGVNWLDTFFKITAIIISVAVPLFVFYRKITTDKNIEQEKKNKDKDNDIRYFKSVLEHVIKGSEAQIKFYREYYLLFRTKKLISRFIPIKFTTVENLKRLLSFEHKRIFDAFIYKYSNDNNQTEIVKDFVNIFENLDCYLHEYESTLDELKKHQEFFKTERENFNIVYDNYRKQLVNYLKKSKDKELIALNQTIMTKYAAHYKILKGIDIGKVYVFVMLPVSQHIEKKGITNVNPDLSEIYESIVSAKKITSKIISKQVMITHEFQNRFIKTKFAVRHLKKYYKKLNDIEISTLKK